MNRHLSQLLNRVSSSSSVDEQQEAVSQVAMLLEKNTRPTDENGFYESVLPAEIRGIHLSGKLQAEILHELVKQNYSQKVLPSVLCAIGKASPSVAAPILTDVLRNLPELPNDPQAAYQAAISLENCLDYDRKKSDFHQVQEAVRTAPIVKFLQQASLSGDLRLAKCAKRILRRLMPQHAP